MSNMGGMKNLLGLLAQITQNQKEEGVRARRRRPSWAGCNVSGCERMPKEGKPYCRDHVGEMHYVIWLQAKCAVLGLEGTFDEPATRDISTLPTFFDWLREGKPMPEAARAPLVQVRKRKRKPKKGSSLAA